MQHFRKTACLLIKCGEDEKQEEEGQHYSCKGKLVTSLEVQMTSYLCCILHPIHRVLRAGLIIGSPVEVDLAQPVGPAERPPGQHWKPKQRKRLHWENRSLYPRPLTSHQTSVFGLSSAPPQKSSQISHSLEVLQKPSPVEDMTMKTAFMSKLVGYGPLKGMLLL